MLAGEPANVEQPRLGRLQPRRVERQRIGSAGDLVLRLARLDQCAVERRQRSAEQRMLGGAALDPPGSQAELRKRAVRPAEQFVEPGQAFAGLEAGLHRGALLGQPCLLAGLRAQSASISASGMGKIVAVALGGCELAPAPASNRLRSA